LFGLGGLIPFVVMSLGIYIFPHYLKLMALYNLINYSVIVLSFIGAVHWGAAISNKNSEFKTYFWSVIPAISSWFILMGFITTNYILIVLFLLLCFVITYFADLISAKKSILPKWYLRLRKILSIVVFICLGLVVIALNNKIV